MSPVTLRQHDVLTYLESHPGATRSEIASALQLKGEQVRAVLETLYRHRLVGRQNSIGIDDSLHGLSGPQGWRWYSMRLVENKDAK